MSGRSRGFALIAALFVLVVVATLGIFSIRVFGAQQSTVDLELSSARADAAVRTGVQYAAARMLAGNVATACNRLTNPLNLPQNFQVTFQGCGQLAVANQPPVTVFSVRVTATRGQYGTPDFVSRQRTVRITTP